MKTNDAPESSLARALPRAFLVSSALFLTPALLAGSENDGPTGGELRERADGIRASAEKLFKLRRVPWVTDPAEGFRLARQENRPVFLYVQAGDPLEDC